MTIEIAEDIPTSNDFPRFASDLPTPIYLEIGVKLKWNLPEIETDGYPLADIVFTPDNRLAQYFIFDKSAIAESLQDGRIL